MERERVTISIKADILKKVDQTIDGVMVRNRSHAIEHLISNAIGSNSTNNAVILVGGKGAQKLLPSVEKALNVLKESGFEKVYIALGSLAQNFKSSLGDGEKYDLDIEYIEEGEGTAGALLPLKKRFKDTFVVINPSEDFGELPLGSLLSFHRSHQSVATISTDNLEELKGTYVLEPEIFNHIPKDFSMLEDDIFPKLSAANQLIVLPQFNL